jgi:hypothetical protein
VNFYDILFQCHNAEKIPYSKTYFDTLFAAKLEELGVKTITGTLPLTFTSKGGNAVDWTIYGNAEGIGERTKNSFEIIPSDQTITETGTLTFTTDAESGTITANGTVGSTEATVKQRFIVTPELAGRYYFSASFGQTSPASTFRAYMYNIGHGWITKWDGTTRSPAIIGDEYQEVLLVEGYTVEITFYVYANKTVDNIVCRPMLRPADTTPEFIPYGYQVPITVSDGQTDKSYDIFIGDAPLTNGQSVSSMSTGQDIRLVEGENVISTTLSNKPKMTIKYFTT